MALDQSSGAKPARLVAREEILALVGEKLESVGKRFLEGVDSKVGIVSTMGDYISGGGGKRLRPTLLLLSSGACGYHGGDDVTYAAVFELIHTATLVHDDIIDGAAIRRGRESVNHRWGNHLTVLMGDHLYLRAMQLAIDVGNLRVLDLLAKITLRMIEGEMIQAHTSGRLDITEQEHLEIVERKTAALFSGCCRVPAILAQSAPERERALAEYGHNLGMAFQLVDDLLDLTADEATLGKPAASDLREGKLTLPLIRLVREGNPERVGIVKAVLEEGVFRSVHREDLLDALESAGALGAARSAAARYAQKAAEAAAHLPESPYKDALLSVPALVLDRES